MVNLYFCGKDIYGYMILTREWFIYGKILPPPLKKWKIKITNYIIHKKNSLMTQIKTPRRTQRLIKIRNKSVNIICPLNYSSFTAQNQFPGLIHLPVRSVLKAGVSSVHPDSNQAYCNQLPTCQTPNNRENL